MKIFSLKLTEFPAVHMPLWLISTGTSLLDAILFRVTADDYRQERIIKAHGKLQPRFCQHKYSPHQQILITDSLVNLFFILDNDAQSELTQQFN